MPSLSETWSAAVSGDSYESNDYSRLIPEDKKISTAQARKLLERGEPERFSDPAELKNIGMPVGGFFAGTVYLGGDGRLWLWDIFNQVGEGIQPRLVDYRGAQIINRDGGNYIEPAEPTDYPDIGFGLQLESGELRPFRLGGFSDISFVGQYPIGEISYADPGVPLEIKLEAFSPFIPLSVDDSSLPLTVQRFTFRNRSEQTVRGQIRGWIENVVGASLSAEQGRRWNRVLTDSTLTGVECGATIPGEVSRDAGTMVLAFLHAGGAARADGKDIPEASGDLRAELKGEAAISFSLEAGETIEITSCISWHFPHLRPGPMPDLQTRFYPHGIASALDAMKYFVAHRDRLVGDTFRWRETWYDSTLPFWFLNRTMANTSTLATSTCYRFNDGRFWAWEGVGSCGGTCTHVWHYAQAVARLFPELERQLRERTDFGLGFDPVSGLVGFRGECDMNPAADGQAAVILRSYREHRQSPDDTFLQRNYGRIKQAMTYLMKMDAEDGALNGMIEGRQHNTLDADWYGKIPAIASLYLCALKAMARMAEHTGDTAFAKECERLFALGQPLYENLFDGDYFIQEVDMEHASAIGTGTGCYIDQVIGVWWAHQLGLSPLFDQEKVHSALRSLWRYNFVPDIGTFREHFKAGRWYAMDDESGMIMCSWPKGGANPAWRDNWQFMYFNECMTGFEWQVAGHFLWEGMVTEGMALSRAIHDRYRASRRNPYNEIECSDHYARAMASYGTFLAACGFEYSGPEGRLGFSPAWNKEYFKAAFTTSEGWGTYEQNLHESGATITIALKYGCLHPRSLKLGSMAHLQIDQVTAFLDENKIDVAPQKDAPSVLLFSDCVELLAGQTLRFEIHF